MANGMFLKPTITVGLRYICGIFHGTFAGDPAMCGDDRPRQSSGEDFELTLRSFKRYKGVVRIDGYCPKTKYFAEGGIQAELVARTNVRKTTRLSCSRSSIVSLASASYTSSSATCPTSSSKQSPTESSSGYEAASPHPAAQGAQAQDRGHPAQRLQPNVTESCILADPDGTQVGLFIKQLPDDLRNLVNIADHEVNSTRCPKR